MCQEKGNESFKYVSHLNVVLDTEGHKHRRER